MNRKWIAKLITGFMVASLAGSAWADTPQDTIVIAWESDIRSFDSRFAVDANSQYVESLIYCSLIRFDENGGIKNDLLAKAPKWLDAKTLKLQIKKGVKFSDGTPVGIDDVMATYRYLLKTDKPSPSPRAGSFDKVQKLDKIDATSLKLTLSEPDASFVSNLVVGILPAKLVGQNPIQDPKNVVGCGPYKVKESSVNSVILTRNDFYTLRQKPKTANIEIKVIKDEKTRFAKLRKGEVDLVQNGISRDILKDIERKFPALSVQRRAAIKTTYLGFNMRDSIVGRREVREAIAHAIDRKVIIDYILNGFAVPAASLLPPGDPFFSKSLEPTSHDLKKANEILDKAGLVAKAGEKYRFKISYKTTTDVTRVNIAKAIASQLRKVGIETVVEPMEWGRFKDDVENGRVQMWSLSWIGFKDPDIFRYAFGSDSFPPNGGNRGWYSNKRLDELLEKGRVTNELAKRKAVYAEVQKLIVEEMPYVFLWHEENFAVYTKTLKDFNLYADGRFDSLVEAYK